MPWNGYMSPQATSAAERSSTSSWDMPDRELLGCRKVPSVAETYALRVGRRHDRVWRWRFWSMRRRATMSREVPWLIA
jgi:hypothetical protein